MAPSTRLGIDDATPPRRARFVTTVNAVAAIGGLVLAVYFVANFFQVKEPWWYHLSPIAVASGMAATLILNRARRYWAATTVFLMSSLLGQVFWFLVWGPGAGNRFYLFPLAATIPLVYEARFASASSSSACSRCCCGSASTATQWSRWFTSTRRS